MAMVKRKGGKKQGHWITTDDDQHVFISGKGEFLPRGPGTKPRSKGGAHHQTPEGKARTAELVAKARGAKGGPAKKQRPAEIVERRRELAKELKASYRAEHRSVTANPQYHRESPALAGGKNLPTGSYRGDVKKGTAEASRLRNSFMRTTAAGKGLSEAEQIKIRREAAGSAGARRGLKDVFREPSPKPSPPKPGLKEQAAAAKADRRQGYSAKDIKGEAKFLKSIPREARRAITAGKRYDRLEAAGKGSKAAIEDRFHNPTTGIREGVLQLRRKDLSEGQKAAVSRAMASTADKVRARMPSPKPSPPKPGLKEQAAKAKSARKAPADERDRAAALVSSVRIRKQATKDYARNPKLAEAGFAMAAKYRADALAPRPTRDPQLFAGPKITGKGDRASRLADAREGVKVRAANRAYAIAKEQGIETRQQARGSAYRNLQAEILKKARASLQRATPDAAKRVAAQTQRAAKRLPGRFPLFLKNPAVKSMTGF